MHKIVIHKAGGYEQLTLESFPDPQPGEGELLIEVKATGVNFADCLVRMGVYSSAKEFVGWPITPGFEVSGVVAALGNGVTQFTVGQKVVALTLFGGYATHLVVPATQVFSLPEELDFAQGAALPTVFITAYYALFDLANAKKGDQILVHSAGGGVGSALVQLGKVAGCKVVGVVGASHKVDFVKSLGADAVIDKSSSDLWAEAKKLAPHGYDIILDANGTETLKEDYRHLSAGGKLVVYGFHSMFTKDAGKPNWFKVAWQYWNIPKFNPFNMITENKSVLAFNLSYLMPKKELIRTSAEQIFRWIKEGKVQPPPIQTFPLEHAAEAQRALESGQTVGKIVLTT